MKDYVVRLIKEKEELKERLKKLKAFLISETFQELPKSKKLLLERQAQIMQTYLDILELRIVLEEEDE